MKRLAALLLIGVMPGCAVAGGWRPSSDGRVTSVRPGVAKGFEDHADVDDCRGVSLTERQAEALLSAAGVITARQANEEFDWAPCVVTGDFSSKRESFTFEITAGLVARLRFPDGREVLLGCGEQCSASVFRTGKSSR